jgi:phosphate transport system regulatory protein PhoU
MEHPHVIFRFLLPTNQDAPVAIHPTVCPFRNPAASPKPGGASDQLRLATTRTNMRRELEFPRQIAHFLKVVPFVQTQMLRLVPRRPGSFHGNAFQRLPRKLEVADVRPGHDQSYGNTVRLMALYQPVGSDLRLLCTILKVNNDLERVADCAVNIAERAEHLDHSAVSTQTKMVRQMATIAQRMLRAAIQAYSMQDADGGQQVFSEDDAVDATYGQIIRGIVTEAADHPDKIAAYLDILSIAKNLERIADHATNIAEDVVYLSTGEIVRHRLH